MNTGSVEMSKASFIEGLKSFLRNDAIKTDRISLELYSYDSSAYIFQPDIVVFPQTVDDISKTIKLAAEHNVPIVARGAGTSLSGGAVPQKGGLVLVCTKLNKIFEFDPVEETVLLECGVVNDDLQSYLAPSGYMFPPDPASQRSSTIGGNIAENAGGIRGVKYGVTKNYVLGLEVVMADGSLATTGALAATGHKSGPDLSPLFAASEGTLGIITKALLKVVPLPSSFRTLSVTFDELSKAGQTVAMIMQSGIIPTALEIMDNALIKALEDYLRLGLDVSAQGLLLIEIDGLGPELDKQMEYISSICRQSGAKTIQSADSEEQRQKLWLARRSGNGAMGRIRPACIVQDVTVPVNKLPQMLKNVQQIAESHNVLIVQMAHAGDGNLHPHLLYDPSAPDEYQRAINASHDIFDQAIAAGGCISGEHGIGLEKIEFMHKQFKAEELSFMHALKIALDPQQTLNPGKLLPPQ